MSDDTTTAPVEAEAAETAEEESRAPTIEWLRKRWYHAWIMRLMWPALFLATLYVFLFFFLNSNAFAGIVRSQLNAVFIGQFELEGVKVNPLMTEIRVEGFAILDPDGNDVIRSREVVAHFRLDALFRDFVAHNTLNIRDIEIHNPDVFLDFRRPSKFNLARAFTPAVPSPDEPSEDPLSIGLHNIRIIDAHIHLAFAQFDLDFSSVNVTHGHVRLEPALYIDIGPNNVGGMTVPHGYATFDPGMFGFPMGTLGASQEGLLLEETAGGTLGAAARPVRHSAKVLATRVLQREIQALDERVDAVSDSRLGTHLAEMSLVGTRSLRAVARRRGRYHLSLANIEMKHFWWRIDAFGFERLNARAAGDTPLEMLDSSMDLAPDNDPEDDIGWTVGSLELKPPVDSRVLRYFLGNTIEEGEPLNIAFVGMEGTLNEGAFGEIYLNSPRLQVAGMVLEKLDVDTTIAAQRVDIRKLAVKVAEGLILVKGHYLILDGLFALDVDVGERNEETGVVSGLNPAKLAEGLEDFAGDVYARLAVEGSERGIGLALREPVRIALENPLPYTDIDAVSLEQKVSKKVQEPMLLHFLNQRVRVHNPLLLEAGPDTLEITDGFSYALTSQTVKGLRLKLNAPDLGKIMAKLGVSGLDVRDVRLEAALDGPVLAPRARVDLHVAQASYGGYQVDSLDLEAELNKGRLQLDKLELMSPLGNLAVRGKATPFKNGQLTELNRSIPLDLRVELTRVPLAQLPLAQLGVEGVKLDGTLQELSFNVEGTHRSPRVTQGRLDIDRLALELPGLDEKLRSVNTRFAVELDNFALKDARVTDFSASFGRDHNKNQVKAACRSLKGMVGRKLFTQSTTEQYCKPRYSEILFDLAALDFRKQTFEIQGSISKFFLEDINALRSVPVQGALELENLVARGDLDAILGNGSPDVPLDVQGRLYTPDSYHPLVLLFKDEKGKVTGERELGMIDLKLSTPVAETLALRGDLLKFFELDASVSFNHEQHPGMRAHARLKFDDLDIFEAAPEVYEAINGDPAKGDEPTVSQLEMAGAIEAFYKEGEEPMVFVTLEKLFAETLGKLEVENHEPIRLVLFQDTVYIEHLDISTLSKSLLVKGTFSLDGQLDVDIDGGLDMALLEILGDVIEDARGALNLDMHVSGNLFEGLEDLDVCGLIEVPRDQPIVVTPRGFGTSIELASGAIDITRDSLDIARDEAISGSVFGGNYTIDGRVTLDGLMPQGVWIRVNGENIAYRIKDEIAVTVNADDLVFDAPDFFTDQDDLTLSGKVEITQGRYTADILSGSLVNTLSGALLDAGQDRRSSEAFEVPIWQSVPLLGKLELDLDVIADRFTIDNTIAGAEVNIELDAELDITGTLKELSLFGDVRIDDGKIDYQGREFEVEPGSFVRFSGEEDINPTLDITARAQINTQSNFSAALAGSSSTDRRSGRSSLNTVATGTDLYNITLTLAGRLNDLEFSLSSSPSLGEADILLLIATGQTSDMLGVDEGGSDALIGLLVGDFVNEQFGSIIGEDSFNFAIADGAAQFVYTQELTRDLSFYGGISIAGNQGNQQVAGIKYKLVEDIFLELIGENATDQGARIEPRLRIRFRLDD